MVSSLQAERHKLKTGGKSVKSGTRIKTETKLLQLGCWNPGVTEQRCRPDNIVDHVQSGHHIFVMALVEWMYKKDVKTAPDVVKKNWHDLRLARRQSLNH